MCISEQAGWVLELNPQSQMPSQRCLSASRAPTCAGYRDSRRRHRVKSGNARRFNEMVTCTPWTMDILEP